MLFLLINHLHSEEQNSICTYYDITRISNYYHQKLYSQLLYATLHSALSARMNEAMHILKYFFLDTGTI